MPKQNEAYRGEDQTLEKIRAKYDELARQVPGDTPDNTTKNKIWDLACEHVYVEFVNEGLMTTANEVLKHTSDDFKIIKTGVIGHIGPEVIMPPRVHQVLAGYDKDGEPEYIEYQTRSGEPL